MAQSTTIRALAPATCPECEYAFQLEDPVVGEVLACPDCQLNLMVDAVGAGGVVLELTDTDAEDWGE